MPNSSYIIKIIFIFFISALTVIHYSPSHLNADVLLNSVMSIQNITLFYWGQNRLANILPLLTSFIKDPSINLYVVLFITAFTHYLLLFLFSWISVKILTKENTQYLDLKVFITITLIFLLVINPGAIFNISIGHIEYPLPLLLVVAVFYRGLIVKDWDFFWITYMMISVVIATGVNYSIILISYSLIFGHFILTRSLNRNTCAFGVVSLLSFLAWSIISRYYGDVSGYSTFSITNQPAAISSVINNILGDFNLFYFIIILAVLLIGRIYTEVYRKNSDLQAGRSTFLITNVMVVFCILWLLLFSSSKWIEMNLYSSRYFTPLVYILFFFLSLQCTRFFIQISNKGGWGITTIAFLSIVIILMNGGFVSLSKYDTFHKTNADIKKYNIFAGDYWLVWPSVLHNLMTGIPAFGLTYRGDANREAIRYFINQQLKTKGKYSVLCLRNEPSTCKNQISTIVGNVNVDQITPLDNNENELFLTNQATKLIFFGESFVALPASTGIKDGAFRVTNGKAGYLIYGPYIPQKAGNYLLRIYGNSNSTSNAIADVVSNQGSIVYAKFPLKSSVINGVLAYGNVYLPSDVDDLEVRVYVSDTDRIKLSKYEFYDH